MMKYKCPNCAEIATEFETTRATVTFKCDSCGWKSGGMCKDGLATSSVSDEATGSPTCKWSSCDGYWETKCDHEWYLPEGTPKENGMNYCPMCGRPLEQ